MRNVPHKDLRYGNQPTVTWKSGSDVSQRTHESRTRTVKGLRSILYKKFNHGLYGWTHNRCLLPHLMCLSRLTTGRQVRLIVQKSTNSISPVAFSMVTISIIYRHNRVTMLKKSTKNFTLSSNKSKNLLVLDTRITDTSIIGHSNISILLSSLLFIVIIWCILLLSHGKYYNWSKCTADP